MYVFGILGRERKRTQLHNYKHQLQLLHTIMGIVCSTDDTTNDTTKDAANPYNFPAETTTMEERNEAARLQRMEDRAMKEAMRASAQQQQQETIDNENVFVSSSDV